MLYEELNLRKKKLEEYVKKNEVNGCTERFRMIHNKGTNQYYMKKAGKKKWEYVKKNKEDEIFRLAQNEYSYRLVNLAKEEIRIIDRFLKESKYDDILNLSEKFDDYGLGDISFYDMNDKLLSDKWCEAVYDTKTFAENTPEFYLKTGVRVRSKSEAEIYNCLLECGIPVKYECPVVVNGIQIFPDFTTLDVKRRKIIYWEHLGMMEDREYSRDAIGRIKLLQKGGITIGDNLILTFENSLNPINRKNVMQLIKQVYDC